MKRETAVVLVSVPGLRARDLEFLPRFRSWARAQAQLSLVPSFPCVTWPVQANLLTGTLPSEHGIVANGLYDRNGQGPTMWTLGNRAVQRPGIWELLRAQSPEFTSAVWFPMLARDCSADFVCMPAPIHRPDGTEGLWCYSRPTELYAELLDRFGHFPLQHFWGPLAGIASSRWIVDSANYVATKFHPSFFYVYIPHLDYAAQKCGPDSEAAQGALREFDDLFGTLVDGMTQAYQDYALRWLVVSEYAITPVTSVTYPNRRLRDAGLLAVRDDSGREELDFSRSLAWCLVDHQFSHVFIRDADPATIRKVRDLFEGDPGIEATLGGEDLGRWNLDHPRSGEVVLISKPDSWQAYYWWLDDARAPVYARTVDIHRKPGYDPVELFWDPVAKGIPLRPELVRGSHGVPACAADPQGVALIPGDVATNRESIRDVDVCGAIRQLLT